MSCAIECDLSNAPKYSQSPAIAASGADARLNSRLVLTDSTRLTISGEGLWSSTRGNGLRPSPLSARTSGTSGPYCEGSKSMQLCIVQCHRLETQAHIRESY